MMLEVVLRLVLERSTNSTLYNKNSCDNRLTLAFKRNHLYEGVEAIKHAVSMTATLLPYQAFSSFKPSIVQAVNNVAKNPKHFSLVLFFFFSLLFVQLTAYNLFIQRTRGADLGKQKYLV